MEGLILFPGFASLKAEVEQLRTEMSMLFLEQDELRFVECKNIEMAYILSLGHLEYGLYKLQIAFLRIKRKLEWIQAKKNRQEMVNLGEIEAALDQEFAQYQARLAQEMEKINGAIQRSHSQCLTQEETKRLKKLYFSVVKALHPDLHPESSEAQISLFHNAVSAYELGDLEGLQMIADMVAQPNIVDAREDTMTALNKEKNRLIHSIDRLQENIATIKQEYPYTMKSLVQDSERLAQKKAELTQISAQLQEMIDQYAQRIAEMTR